MHDHGGVLSVWSAATSMSQPASTRLMNASTPFGNGGVYSAACSDYGPSSVSPTSAALPFAGSRSRFQSATRAS